MTLPPPSPTPGSPDAVTSATAAGGAAPGRVRPLVVLVGPPGAGKSTVARRLADRLAVVHRDTDHDVEAGAGRSVPQIFADRGEAVFRAMETDALYTALRTHDGVLSLGGGAPLAAYNQELLAEYAAAGGLVVFLDVTPDVAVARMGDTHGRPLLAGDARGRFVELMAVRREVYEKVATLHLDTSDRNPDDVVDLVVAHLAPADQEGTRTPPAE